MTIAAIVVGITVYSSYSTSLSSLFSWLTNANSEVIILPPLNSKPTVTLGALLPLSGISSSLGESEKAALQIGVNDVNDYFSKTTSNTRVELIIEDTQTNPVKSMEKLRQLAEKGVKIVIGPATSAELQSTEDYANENGILLISPSSTAPSVVIRGKDNDTNVFRLVPDDTHQAQAISRHA